MGEQNGIQNGKSQDLTPLKSLGEELSLNNIGNSLATERLLKTFRLYQEKGTLEAVGREMGITRERVRQILAKGKNLGLFEYKPQRKSYQPFISKEKILDDYKKCLSLMRVAKENNLSIYFIGKVLVENNITKKNLSSVKKAEKKLKCINEYKEIVEELGHHPTTTELQRSKSWSSLLDRVYCLWGPFNAFRKELNVPGLNSSIT